MVATMALYDLSSLKFAVSIIAALEAVRQTCFRPMLPQHIEGHRTFDPKI